MMENPLRAWLERNNLRPYTFAKRAGIAQRTAYRMAFDEGAKFETDTLLKVEAATGGEVTIRQMINWLNQPPPIAVIEESPEEEMIEVERDEFEAPDDTEEPD